MAEKGEEDAAAERPGDRPASRGPSVNVARRRLPEAEASGPVYKDILRPIEDVRPFQHQVTKGRYDRWAESSRGVRNYLEPLYDVAQCPEMANYAPPIFFHFFWQILF